MPKFEANMNFYTFKPFCSMKLCNKRATVRFYMELLLSTTTRIATTRKQSLSGATPSASTGMVGNKYTEN